MVNHGNLRVKKVEITLFGHYKMSVVISIKNSRSICFYLLRGSFCVKLWVTTNSLHSKLLPSFSSLFILNLSEDIFFHFIRPPGHHADTEFAMGYCFFNNVAVAAKIAQQRWNVQRYLLKRNWAMGCWINLLCYAGNDWVNCHKYVLNKMLYFSNMWPETLSCLSSISGLAIDVFYVNIQRKFFKWKVKQPIRLKGVIN